MTDSLITVAVAGAGGRMGSTVCAAVAAAPDLELVGAVDPGWAGTSLDAASGRQAAEPGADTIEVVATIEELDAHPDVLVDFTVVESARANLGWCAANGVHAVVGTTGFDGDDLERLASLFTDSNCLIAPNFAIGAVLMMRFAEMAAPWFESAEIIELHHDAKVDAPSGTALATAGRMAEASSEWTADPTTNEKLPGARGGEGPGGIHIHSVRLRGLVAHQEVLLGTVGQSLTLRHDSYDRTSFMPGVLLGCRRIAEHPGLTVGLDAFLDI